MSPFLTPLSIALADLGFSPPNSDIDLTILCPSFGHTKLRSIFEQLAGVLLSYSIISSRALPDCEMVLSARFPILEFSTTRALGSFSVDVSLGGTKGVAGATVSRALLDESEEGKRERAERLVLLWKTFLRAHGVHEVRYGGIGELSSFFMVVSYLQVSFRSFSAVIKLTSPRPNSSNSLKIRPSRLHQ